MCNNVFFLEYTCVHFKLSQEDFWQYVSLSVLVICASFTFSFLKFASTSVVLDIIYVFNCVLDLPCNMHVYLVLGVPHHIIC